MVVRILHVLFLTAGSFTLSIGQVIHSEELTAKSTIREVSLVPSGDSILLSYEGYSNGKDYLVMRWIRPGKEFTSYNLGQEVFHISSYLGNRYYYYISKKQGALTLNSLEEKVGTSTRRVAANEIVLPEGIQIAKFADSILYILTYNKKLNALIQTEVLGMEVRNTRTYVAPVDLSKYIKENVETGLFQEGQVVNTFSSHAKVKVFRSPGLIRVLVDKTSTVSGVPEESLVLTLKEDGSITHDLIVSPSKEDFSSFLGRDKLFRFTISNKMFELTVLDMGTKTLIARKEIVKGAEDFNVYFRSGSENTIDREETLKHMMAVQKYCVPAISVIPMKEKYLIQCGTYFNSQGGSYSIINSNPLASIIATAIQMIVSQTKEPPGVSRYYYVLYDSFTKSFSYPDDSLVFTRKKIDEYELERAGEKVRFDEKVYVPFRNGLVAAYVFKKRGRLELVYFE